MSILQLEPHLTVEQLKERMQKEQQVFCFKRGQILHAVASNRGQSAESLSLLLGCSAHVIKRTVQRYNKVLLFADGAGWHKSKDLQLPPNIQLQLLPPYSLELNPTEQLWDYIREQKGFNNHCFGSLEELEYHLETILKHLHQEKDYI